MTQSDNLLLMDTSEERIKEIISRQKAFFATGKTNGVSFRLAAMKRFRKNIRANEGRICDALWKDLRKSHQEAYITEVSMVLKELDYHIACLSEWTRSERVAVPISLFPARSRVIYQPLGVSLIIAPWNYPFLLMMDSMIGALSSGCCAVLKPSPYTRYTALVMQGIVEASFAEEHVAMVQGGRAVNTILLAQRWDMIFFTGSTSLGRHVMSAAAEHLTPLVLELGGKSPCIVDREADLRIAARRIAWGKWLNAGQTCIAPDYLLVHEDIREALMASIIRETEIMYGRNPADSPHFPRIVNSESFRRLSSMLSQGKILYGGSTCEEDLYIAPTLIEPANTDDLVMTEEIFGPLLPILGFRQLDEAISFVNAREKPLALYYFGRPREARRVIAGTDSGTVGINDTVMQIASSRLPFGGVGNSGFGKYHGKDSFMAFSHKRSLLITPARPDWPMRYPPFRLHRLLRFLLKL
jgi:aldehyde dehydrogenase (NAD+)